MNGGLGDPGPYRKIEGIEHLDKLIAIDQSPIGRTPRSNPSTYIKVFDDIRKLYAMLPDSKARGYQEGRFSFNVSGGRCEACEGNGSNRLEMDFLADVWVTCPVCEGHRFNRETLQVRFKGKNIAEVLEMDIQQALEHFSNIPKVQHKLQTLHDVGLDYLKLGQPSPTLSGGEAQRVKLARELVKKSTGRTLYLLDEPTTGLHFADIQMLLKVLHDFVDAGNTVLVVEHNLDVIKTADWLIDLGPEGGAGGGRIVAAGTPEEIVRVKESHTGRALLPILTPGGERISTFKKSSVDDAEAKARAAKTIRVQGARQHNLKSIDVEVPRDQITVCCGPSGIGQELAGHGHDLCRRPAALRRKPQLLRPAVRRPDAKAAGRPHRRAFAGHRHRAEAPGAHAALDASARSRKSTTTCGSSSPGLGQPHCPDCDVPIGTQSADEIIDKVMGARTGTKLYLMAPIDIQVGERYETLWEEIRAKGYVADAGRSQDVLGRPAADDRSPPQAPGRGGGRSGRGAAATAVRGLPTASRARWPWARACCTWLIRTTTCPKRTGRPKSTASILPARNAAAASSS